MVGHCLGKVVDVGGCWLQEITKASNITTMSGKIILNILMSDTVWLSEINKGQCLGNADSIFQCQRMLAIGD